MNVFLTWLIRFVHVVFAASWVGGYAIIVLVIVPLLRKKPQPDLITLTQKVIRVLTYTGLFTIIAGTLLIARTRGYEALFHGEWGSNIITGLVIALVLMGIGDSALRPALRRLTEPDSQAGRRLQLWVIIGLVLGLIAVASMTRAIYSH